MKHTILTLATALFITAFFSGFTKHPGSRHFSTDYTQGPWGVQYYSVNEQQQDALMNNIFVFSDNGTFAVYENKVAGDPVSKGYYAPFAGGVKLEFMDERHARLSGEWKNSDTDDASLQLARQNEDNVESIVMKAQ
jgi:hypothetical protein